LFNAMIERDDEIDLVLTALLAAEHVLLVGPPGCGKSLLLDSVLKWSGGSKFAVLLTKFSTLEELMGPVSLTALKADRYLRVTTGKLPEAEYAFVDECFEGSSAVLNTLLKILNERVYDAGDGVARPVPLKLCVAASNEWASPDTGKELAALSDRFLLRKAVSPIRSHAGRQRLLWTRDHAPEFTGTVTPGEVEQARTRAAELPWSAAAKEARPRRPATVQDGERGAGVRLPERGGRGAAGTPGSGPPLPVGRPPGAALENRPGDRPDRQPDGDAVSQLLLEAEQVLATADPKHLADAAKAAAKAAAKLGEIDKQLAALTGHSRAEKAHRTRPTGNLHPDDQDQPSVVGGGANDCR
jgi:MoxR-like ATPase